MKTAQIILNLIIILLLTSCNVKHKVYPICIFDSPFPKRNINLKNILGEKLIIRSGSDTLTYRITSNKRKNLIINNNTGDTVFFGTVSKYRGLLYFNEKLNDSSYWIYAVKISENLIYGLNTAWSQLLFVDESIRKGKNKNLVKYINSDTTIIRLHPNKQELNKLYTSIIRNISPDTILNFQETFTFLKDSVKTLTQFDPEEYEYVLKAYPNPTSNLINIELQNKNKLTYHLCNMEGKIVLQGQFTEKVNRIVLSNLPNGIYILKVLNQIENKIEKIKIMKQT